MSDLITDIIAEERTKIAEGVLSLTPAQRGDVAELLVLGAGGILIAPQARRMQDAGGWGPATHGLTMLSVWGAGDSPADALHDWARRVREMARRDSRKRHAA